MAFESPTAVMPCSGTQVTWAEAPGELPLAADPFHDGAQQGKSVVGIAEVGAGGAQERLLHGGEVVEEVSICTNDRKASQVDRDAAEGCASRLGRCEQARSGGQAGGV